MSRRNSLDSTSTETTSEEVTETAQAAPDAPGFRDVTSTPIIPPPLTVDPALAENIPHRGANKHYADRPQLDPVEAAKSDVPLDAAAVAKAEKETTERMVAMLERKRQQAEAEQAIADATAERNANAPLIKSRSEYAEMTIDEQLRFRNANGTVCEDTAK